MGEAEVRRDADRLIRNSLGWSRMWKVPAVKDEVRKIRRALEQIDACGDLRNVAGSRSEKLALVRFARTRGLIVWRETRGRHELTPDGRKWLTANGGAAPVRRKQIPLRLIGAAVGVIALAAAWFSAAASLQLFRPVSNGTMASPASPGSTARRDSMATGVATVKLPADGPLALIRTEAAVFAAARQAGAMASDAPQPAGVEPSKTADQETKAVAKPRHKTARASRHRSDDRGSAMAFAEPDRPRRTTFDDPWGFWRPQRNAWR